MVVFLVKKFKVSLQIEPKQSYIISLEVCLCLFGVFKVFLFEPNGRRLFFGQFLKVKTVDSSLNNTFFSVINNLINAVFLPRLKSFTCISLLMIGFLAA